MVFGILKALWNDGAEIYDKYKWSLALEVFLLVAILTFAFMGIYGVTLVLCIAFFIISIVIAGHYCISEILPTKQMRIFFDNIFREMNFQTSGRYPYFLAQENKHDYIKSYNFTTYCPLKTWLEKKDLFEMHLNEKILDIKQDEKNKRLVSIHIETEPLPDMINWNDRYLNKEKLLAIGICHYGIIVMRLERDPHAFVAGETGGGKSNILKCLIHQALYKDYEVELIDFKRGVSFMEFSDKVTVHYEYTDVIRVLRNMVTETSNRLDKFRTAEVDNINDYNKAVSSDYLKRKILFIDELAELLKTRDKEISKILNDSIETLTRLSRAVGIHLIMGIQRPDSTIVSGQIKNNVPFRICGRFVDKEPSRIMLGNDSAYHLPNIKGRFMVKEDDFYETQCFFFKMDKPKSTDTSTQVKTEYNFIDRPKHALPLPPTEKTQQPKIVETKTATVNNAPPKQKPEPPKTFDTEPKTQPKEKSKAFEFDFSEFKK